MDYDLTAIAVVRELERAGVSYEYETDSNVRVLCPFHEVTGDHSPSCSVDTTKRVFICRSCKADGDIVTFLARRYGLSRSECLAELAKRYTLNLVKIVDVEVIERWHKALAHETILLKALHDRAVTDTLIRKYRLGAEDGRITIPIKDESGNYVNVRKYLPGAPSKLKIKNMRGRGKPMRLFPIEQLQYDKILLTGGECKALAALDQLNRHGIGAVTATQGEENWTPELTPKFTGKTVYVATDIDEAGRRAANALCATLNPVVEWIGDLCLPLDIVKYPKGDINDFIASGGELFPLLADVPRWEPKLLADNDTDAGIPASVSLSQAVQSQHAGKRIQVNGVVAAMCEAPYVVPSNVKIVCDKQQKVCGICPVMIYNKDEYAISPESESILDMIGTAKDNQRLSIMRTTNIPITCPSCDPQPTNYYNVEDVRISPQLEITSRADERTMQPAVIIGSGIELNQPYRLTGKMRPHPKTQQATLVLSEFETTEDSLSSYQCNDLDRLTVFQPDNWTVAGIDAKLEQIYNDLSANVTRIYQRRTLHEFVDLAYHSPLFLKFDGQTIKGWVETLVIGDSSQGKSEVICGSGTRGGLMAHYELGVKIDAKNATVAGVLGGMQHIGTKWLVSWGIVPTHDKRLVIFEELKGAPPEMLSKLTDMRSSGVAMLPKIEKKQTYARTRMIMSTNTKSGRDTSAYNFGVETVVELIHGLEDIRRYDMILVLSRKDVDPKILNMKRADRAEVPHVFTGELCRSLILWGWTRDVSQVVFAEGAEAACLKAANEMCELFSESIPIVDRGSMRYKLARLAASLACRTFSTSEDFLSIVVRPAHVEYIAQMLIRTYSSPTFGYLDYSIAAKMGEKLLDPDIVRKHLRDAPYAADLCKQILHTTNIELNDLKDWCGYGHAEATQLLSLFVRKHALTRDGRSYRKAPAFISLLRKLIEDNDFPIRPDFIKTEF